MHAEALTKEAAELFPRLARFSKFYLVGGTAMALQIGHRLSVDFDMFSGEKLKPNLLSKINREFGDKKIAVTYRSPEQINLLIDNVKFTFFYYPYPVIEPLIKMKGVPTASLIELAAMKALAVGQRLSYKDYIDWYFLLKEKHITLGKVIELAKKKFGGNFNDRLFLGQLVSADDIPVQKIDFLRNETDKDTVEKLLREKIQAFNI